MSFFPDLNKCTVAVIGLGYVGLPLAVELAKSNKCRKRHTLVNRDIIGFDINQQRLDELNDGLDRTNEIEQHDLKNATSLVLTSNPDELAKADVFIVTVPTPITSSKQPVLFLWKKQVLLLDWR